MFRGLFTFGMGLFAGAVTGSVLEHQRNQQTITDLIKEKYQKDRLLTLQNNNLEYFRNHRVK